MYKKAHPILHERSNSIPNQITTALRNQRMTSPLINFYESQIKGDAAQVIVSDERRKRNQIEKELLTELESEYIMKATTDNDEYIGVITTVKAGLLQDDYKELLIENGFNKEQILLLMKLRGMQRKVKKLNVSKRPKRVSKESILIIVPTSEGEKIQSETNIKSTLW